METINVFETRKLTNFIFVCALTTNFFSTYYKKQTNELFISKYLVEKY